MIFTQVSMVQVAYRIKQQHDLMRAIFLLESSDDKSSESKMKINHEYKNYCK